MDPSGDRYNVLQAQQRLRHPWHPHRFQTVAKEARMCTKLDLAEFEGVMVVRVMNMMQSDGIRVCPIQVKDSQGGREKMTAMKTRKSSG